MAFTPKFKTPAVFAVVEHGSFPNKKSQRCALTGVTIEYGDPAYMVKFKDYNDAERLYVSEEAARRNEAFRLSVDNLEKRMVPAELMFYSDRERAEIVDPEWLEYKWKAYQRRLMRRIMELPSRKKQQKMLDDYSMSLRGMSLDAIRAELEKPDPPRHEQLTADALWDKIWNKVQTLKDEPNTFHRGKIWEIFGAVVMSELHQRLLERFAELMPEFKVMLACSDNHAFVRLAEESGLLPGWGAIHALVGKSRIALDDMLAFAEWGKANPDALALLWKTHVTFGILSFDTAAPVGYSEMLKYGHGAYLLFLYTARPDLCPMLEALVPEAPFKQGDALKQTFHGFVPSDSYQYPYLYRAKVFEFLLAGNAAEARRMVGLMREHVDYYYHGDPSGFINATEKMAERYIKKYLK
jgi:hypothetical protein